MTVFVSLLRGINVGGQRKVPMASLRDVYQSAGACNVTTFIQSGNVVFDSPEADESELVSLLEKAITDRFGFPVPVLIRSLGEWQRLTRHHPLSPGADPAHLHVACLSRPPDAQAVRALTAINAGDDRFTVAGREVYLHCPNGYARTKLNNTVLEKKLGTVATTRNWKTVGKLLELAEALSPA